MFRENKEMRQDLSLNVPICPVLSQNVPFCPKMSCLVPKCPVLSQNVLFCPNVLILVPKCPNFGPKNVQIFLPKCPNVCPKNVLTVGIVKVWQKGRAELKFCPQHHVQGKQRNASESVAQCSRC
jgi:hypothetical protein